MRRFLTFECHHLLVDARYTYVIVDELYRTLLQNSDLQHVRRFEQYIGQLDVPFSFSSSCAL